MEKKLKILAVTFDTEMSGGANRSFIMVISRLHEVYGHEIYTILPGNGPIEIELAKHSLPYKSVPMPRVGVHLTGSLKDVLRKGKTNWKAYCHKRAARKLAREFANEQYDLVYINGSEQLCGRFLADFLRIPFVWHFRGYLKAGYYASWQHNRLYNDPNGKIIVISRSMVEMLPRILGIHPDQIVLVHNGLQWTNNEFMTDKDRTKGIHCVLCGRFVKSKGQLEAIQALDILRHDGFDQVYLHLAGDYEKGAKPYVKELQAYIREHHLEDRVRLEGQVSHMGELRKYMNIELMCSECEPFGRVTVEGMRSGLVVIGANTGGTLDIIQDGENGLLYQQGNPVDLAKKIRYVIEHEQQARELAQRASEFTKTHFTMEKNVHDINQVLLKVAGKES